MTNDELAKGFEDLFAETHARVDALPDGPQKTRAKRLLDVFHRSGELFADHAIEMDEVQPLGGTNKPPL